ncbi:MAG TPA: hypothetical protein VK668_04330 [Mucilaginibacter sp.]|nr:hypothetical protein [Mucilaginibacter sp.]
MMKKTQNNDLVKPTGTLTPAILFIGAIGSLVLLWMAGHNNSSVILMTLFTIWVLSPYAALLVVDRKSLIPNAQLRYLSIFIAGAAIFFYTLAHFTPSKTPAFIFLLIPLLSWLVIFIVVLIKLKKKKKLNADDV